MNVSAHTIRRLVSVTGLAAVVAALTVPTALARPATVDGDTMFRTQVALDLRSPDTRDATVQVSGLDPAIATAMVAYKRQQAAVDLRSPDTRESTTKASGLDPAIATAIAAHQRQQVVADLRSPDTKDVTFSPIAQDSPVAAPATGDETNWGLVAAMIAAVGVLFIGVGALALQGHGKRHGTVNPV